MRTLLTASFFAAACAVLVGTSPARQPPKDDKKPAQPKFDPPKVAKPDDDTLKQIAAKTEQLRLAVNKLKAPREVPELPDVEIFLVAAERIVRHNDWFTADSGKRTLQILDIGLARAVALAKGQTPWLNARGKWVVLGYRSRIDGSVQPYAVVFPNGYGEPNLRFRMDVVLHGRDSTLTEVKFLSANEGKAAPPLLDHAVVQIFGRGNNAYRWAGEGDVFEAMADVKHRVLLPQEGKPDEPIPTPLNANRIVLRGFSMGGAGTWHLGLHHPGRFCVIGPGAGFTTTHGYIGNLPKELPEYQEKCLRIYDAVDYAENAFNVPVVAYSGEKDAQKAAADNIERALKDFKEPLRFTHIVAPGLEHQMPPQWQAKADTEYRKYADKGRDPNTARVRFVTYTPRYGKCDWVTINALDKTYERGVIDATRKGNSFQVKTTNIRRVILSDVRGAEPCTVTLDGQDVRVTERVTALAGSQVFEKLKGQWTNVSMQSVATRLGEKPEKRGGFQGPIDDAFIDAFQVVKPVGPGWNAGHDKFLAASVDQFAYNWDKYLHGLLPIITTDTVNAESSANLVLFGDPQSNPLIAKVLPKLPLSWTKDELVVNGVKYDPKTHVPVLIYPNQLEFGGSYLVINSGHTFKEADLKGTNALLYPRLGDWAVIKPTPTEKDPTAYEVVAAGLFDENWQFPK